MIFLTWRNTTINTKGDQLSRLKTKWLKIEKENPLLMKYIYDLYDDFSAITVAELKTLEVNHRTGLSLHCHRSIHAYQSPIKRNYLKVITLIWM